MRRTEDEGPATLEEETQQRRTDAIQSTFWDLEETLRRAYRLHTGDIHSLHEGYATILEEFEEFWAEVRKKESERDMCAAYTELLHTAAMCMRTIIDLALDVRATEGRDE